MIIVVNKLDCFNDDTLTFTVSIDRNPFTLQLMYFI